MKPHIKAWDWSKFVGDPACLKWNRRDLRNLAQAIDLCEHRRVAVQAGGNLGIFAKYLASCFDAVYTFEPEPLTFLKLCHNAPETNIVRFQAALDNAPRMVSAICERQYKSHMPVHEGITHVVRGGIIPTMRIDDLPLAHCDLIYLDIEGLEGPALAGGADTIAVHRPVIGVEINDCAAAKGHDPQYPHKMLGALGYREAFKLESDVLFLHETHPHWSTANAR